MLLFFVAKFPLPSNTCHVGVKGFGFDLAGILPRLNTGSSFGCRPPRDRKCWTQEVACCLNGNVCPPSRRPWSPDGPKLLFSCLPSPRIKWLSLSSTSLAAWPPSTGVALRFTSHPRPRVDEAGGCFIIIFCFFFLLFFFLLTWKEQTTGAFSISDVSLTARGRLAARTALHGR